MIPSDCTDVLEIFKPDEDVPPAVQNRPLSALQIVSMLLTTMVLVFLCGGHCPPGWSPCNRAAINAIIVGVFVTLSFCMLKS